jgi:hypothetical protein
MNILPASSHHPNNSYILANTNTSHLSADSPLREENSNNSRSSSTNYSNSSSRSNSLTEPSSNDLIEYNGKTMTLAEAEALIEADLDDTQTHLATINKLNNVVTDQYTSHEDIIKVRNYPTTNHLNLSK